ncbi:cytoskeletal protein binding protein [Saxophila tyrrhenica]|uniref:Actin cytoskeleton-regulatory complex protein SLA1 n=1 Tax=Saxophila tyrrhenica TaxID=1690608 RepID=A0AAV9PN52_9PEZI|nr:cytoskeletal protein binding protein [Saxophila tyrrhenica]
MAFLQVVRAVYDYAPQSDEELEIKDGDLLFVLEKSSEDDWWKCKKKAASEDEDEPEGLVPNNYVEEVKPTHPAKALYDYTKQTDEELSFQEGAQLQVYDQTDPDWTLVGRNGEYGFVPAIYIEHLPAGGSAAPVAAPAPPAMPPRSLADDDDDDGPLPGEADYVPPSSPQTSSNNPAAALAGIIAQKTGGATDSAPSTQRTLAAPPPMAPRPQYTPEESDEEEAPPPKPQRPQSNAMPSPSPIQSPARASPPVRSPARTESQYVPSGTAEAGGIFPSPPSSARTPTFDDYDVPRSPAGYRLYSIHEVITHMGKSKKLPMTLGINLQKGVIRISPDKSKDGEAKEWSAEKLEHYSIEGKHVFVELVRPSRSVDFHAGAKETAQEIVAHLGEVAGASRAIGLSEVLEASAGTGTAGLKTGQMLYEFMAQGDDEVTVAVGDEVIVLDDTKSDEWWMVRRLKNGKEGVVPSSYVEVTGTVPTRPDTALDAARSTVEQNRLEEERLAKDAAKGSRGIPERGSSLTGESSSSRSKSKRGTKEPSGAGKSKPNPTRVRMWTDRSGTFKVEAEFIGLREGKIHLHKMNGVKIAVPVAKMSVEDLEYVEKATGASLDEDKPLSDIKRRSTQKKTNGAGAGAAGASVVPKDHEYWFDFFLQCGVNPQICDRYASAFSRDQMSPEVLPEVNEQLLRTLGLKEGDIIRVVKFLDSKYDRKKTVVGGPGASSAGDQDTIEHANGSGLFSGPGGALKNNTRKGRPAPAVQTNDVVSEDAFKTKDDSSSPAARSPNEGAQRTVLASAPAREAKTGFDDDAWDVKPARTQTPELRRPEEPSRPAEPPKPRMNDDIASLSITSPPLQPTPAAPPAPVQSPPPEQQQPQAPPGANQQIFDKIASLAPRQRPNPPPQQQQTGGALSMPPPPRAASAPGFQPQQNGFGNVAPLQAQLTGYQQQYQQPMQPQQTSYQQPQGYGGFQGQQQNGFMPQQTGVQAMQQNYPALQPQPTGLNFQPQSSFGQQQQSQLYPGGNLQQQLVNGAQTGSPFADPPRQPYQPNAPSGLHNSFSMPQQTGFQPQQTGFQPQQTGFQPQQQQQTGFQQQQPSFNIAAPTGMNGGYGAQPQQGGAPQLPPQQTGGVFGPSQPVTPLVPQKTGPAPPVRFGVQPGDKKLMPQPTGRANLAKATPQNPFGF